MLAVVMLSLGVAFGSNPAASADVLPADTSSQPSAAFPACIAEAVDVGTRPTDEQRRPVCFRTQSEALAAATGDARYLTHGEAFAVAVSRGRATPLPVLPNANVITGVDWTGSNQTGESLTWKSTTKCTTGVSKLANILGDWNDSVTSAVNFPSSACGNWYHYEHPNQGGALIDCGYERALCGSYIGDAMNNRSSSLKWTR